MTKTIRIEDWADAAQTEITLSGRRQLKLRQPIFRARNQANWSTRRPGWGNAKAAADAILLRAGVDELDSSDLTELSERDRRRLIVAVVQLVGAEKDWHRLYGTSLGLNERFLATLIWAERREASGLQNGLREMRERLREHPRTRVQAISCSTPCLTGLAKQLAAMNSFAQLAKLTSLSPRFEFPSFAWKASELGVNGIGTNLGAVRVAEVAMKTSILDHGVSGRTRSDLTGTGLLEGWRVGITGAGLRDTSRIAEQMSVLSIGKEFCAASFAAGLSARIPSLASQLDFTSIVGASPFKTSISSALLSGSLSTSLAKLEPAKFGFGGEIWRQTQTTVESLLMEEMARLWGNDPLWFLISYLNPRKLPPCLTATARKSTRRCSTG